MSIISTIISTRLSEYQRETARGTPELPRRFEASSPRTQRTKCSSIVCAKFSAAVALSVHFAACAILSGFERGKFKVSLAYETAFLVRSIRASRTSELSADAVAVRFRFARGRCRKQPALGKIRVRQFSSLGNFLSNSRV